MGKLWCVFSKRDPLSAVKVFLAVAVFSFGRALAQEPSEQDFLNLPAVDVAPITPSEKITVGDRIELKLVATEGGPDIGAQTITLEVPEGSSSLNDLSWEIIQVEPGKTQAMGPSSNGEFRFIVTPLKPGKLTLPALVVKKVSGAEVPAESLARTNPWTTDVVSAIGPNDQKPQEPADPRPPVGVGFPWWLVVAAAIGLLGVVAGVVYLLYRLSKKRRLTATRPLPSAPPRPEDAIALMALEQLEREELWRKGRFKAHYFKVSDIVKSYFGARYSFDAMESTTSEILTFFERHGAISDKLIDRVETLFNKLDRVKFTDHEPVPEEGLKVIADSRELVLSTRRVPSSQVVSGQPTSGQATSGVVANEKGVGVNAT